MVNNLRVNTGDMGSIPDLGRSHMLRSDQVRAPQLASLWSGPQKPQLEKSPYTTTREAPADHS